MLVEEGKEINSKRTNNSVKSTNNSEKEGGTEKVKEQQHQKHRSALRALKK